MAERLPARIQVSRRELMLDPDRDPETDENLEWMLEGQIVPVPGSPSVVILLWLGGNEADAYWKVRQNYGAWGAMSGLTSQSEAEEVLEELHRILEKVVDEFCAPVDDSEPLFPPFPDDEDELVDL